MDFLEDLFDFGDRDHRKRRGIFQHNDHDEHYDDDHDDDHHYQQHPISTNPPSPQAAHPFQSGQVCPNCSTPLMQGAQFCHRCGTKISLTKVCASCGSTLPSDAAFCPQCGYKSN